MKKSVFILAFFLTLFLISCGQNNHPSEHNLDPQDQFKNLKQTRLKILQLYKETRQQRLDLEKQLKTRDFQEKFALKPFSSLSSLTSFKYLRAFASAKQFRIISSSVVEVTESQEEETSPPQRPRRIIRRQPDSDTSSDFTERLSSYWNFISEKTPVVREFVYEQVRQAGQDLYEMSQRLYEGGEYIADTVESWIADQIESFQQERERQRQDELEVLTAIWDLKTKRRREERRIEAEVILIRERTREEITNWVSFDYEQREELRSLGQSIENKYNVSFLPEGLQTLVEETEAQDDSYREVLNDIRAWADLTYEERRRLQNDNQGIRSRYNFPDLPENLQVLITNTEYRDRQRQTEIENQWARLRFNEAALRAALGEIESFSAENYYYLGIKLFPIHYNRDGYYNLTNNQDMMSLSVADDNERLRLEIHDLESNSEAGEVLAENVQELQMNIECPDQLNCEDNVIRYKVSGSEQFETYLLSNLNDYQNGRAYYIRVVPYNPNLPTRVTWGSGDRVIDRRYRGFFRIQIAKKILDPNNSEVEWSFINDVSIESYLRSVTPSELAPDEYPNRCYEALKAQAIAARSYALSVAIRARTSQARSWDMTPTVQFQAYRGSEVENSETNNAVRETEGIVLLHNGNVARTEYFACRRTSTIDFPSNPIMKARNVPSYISCSNYGGGAGHGRGINQIAISSLSCIGWSSDATNLPTEDAIVPENFREAWNYEALLFYFYHNVQLYDYINNVYL